MEHPVERMQIYKTIVDAAELIARRNFKLLINAGLMRNYIQRKKHKGKK